jgi:large subunit ribosomal protein L19
MQTAVKTSPVNMKARVDLNLHSGDTVRVWQNIVELKQAKKADKKLATVKNTRKQAFEGLVLAVKHGHEAGATFTVRKVTSGVGVEKIFPLYSPMIDSIEVLRRASTRRAKLYFIREKASRDQKRAMRKSVQVSLTTNVPEEEVVEEAPTPEAPDAPVPAAPAEQETPAVEVAASEGSEEAAG